MGFEDNFVEGYPLLLLRQDRMENAHKGSLTVEREARLLALRRLASCRT